jgi:catechol 2,3-dioxygenase-like lactoylglutathione lyase family enzyme
MELLKIGWLGTRTGHAAEMADLLQTVLGLRLVHRDLDMWVFQLPDGSKVEVFGPTSHNEHFTTGPVPGFLVDDLASATEELRAAGVSIVSGPTFWPGEDGVGWVHFRAPDGRLYEITQGRDLAEHQSD